MDKGDVIKVTLGITGIDRFFVFSGLYLPAVPVDKLPTTSADTYVPELTFQYKHVTFT